jgi:hemoglobin
MLPDIQSRDDIVRIVDTFYERVKQDELLGPIFTEKAKVNWEKHLPVMYDFWENVVFYTGNYSGNPMRIHQQLHQRIPLAKADFNKWLKLFFKTVDQLYRGEHAELIKQRAQSIATVMQLKILYPKDGSLL